jgi:hypothetical protein
MNGRQDREHRFVFYDLGESFLGLKIISFYITKISLWQLYSLKEELIDVGRARQ